MEQQTPTRSSGGLASGSRPQTPISKVLQRVGQLTPSPARGFLDLPNSPAIRRLDESALRAHLKEAYMMLKEKERNLFLAATVGQELVESNQKLQDNYDTLQRELEIALSALSEKDCADHDASRSEVAAEAPSNGFGTEVSRLHGRRKSMALQNAAPMARDLADEPMAESNRDTDNLERRWTRVHLNPLKDQLQMTQDHVDELLAEREDLSAQLYSARQESLGMSRRTAESLKAKEDIQHLLDKAEEENAELRKEIEDLRSYWSKTWNEHKEICSASDAANQSTRLAEMQANDAAGRLRAEKKVSELQAELSRFCTETKSLKSRIAQIEEERATEWVPMRERWLSCEEALQELQDSHQSTCDALAQAEARLAEIDKETTVSDPLKLKSERTSTSLLGELDVQRHRAVSRHQDLVREHTALKRAYTRAMNTRSRMKQQVSRLTQLAATGANEARMKRLEAALGEAECQKQALLWANMDQRQVDTTDLDLATSNGSQCDGTALIMALRAKIKHVSADRDQAQRELRTAHLLRANEMQRTRELEREASEAETQFRRAISELTTLKLEYDSLKRASKASKRNPKGAYNSKPHSPLSGQSAKREFSALSSPNASAQPPRKRTTAGSNTNTDTLSSETPSKKTGPMSLAFVINEDSEKGPKDAGKSDRHLTDTSNRPGMVPPSDSAAILASRSIFGSKNDADSDIVEFSDAANRGLKDLFGKLAEDHAAALGGIVHGRETAASNNIGSPNGSAKSSNASGNSDSRRGPKLSDTQSNSVSHNKDKKAKEPSPDVDEIFIGSRKIDKPIECNNQ